MKLMLQIRVGIRNVLENSKGFFTSTLTEPWILVKFQVLGAQDCRGIISTIRNICLFPMVCSRIPNQNEFENTSLESQFVRSKIMPLSVPDF